MPPLLAPARLAPPRVRRGLAIRGANSEPVKIGATTRGANSVPTKMCEPTAGAKNAQRKIGSSARKSKRKNYRTIPQRRDISVDVRRVRRRLLVRVTLPVHQTLPAHQTLLVRQALARRARLVGAIEFLISVDGTFRVAGGRDLSPADPAVHCRGQNNCTRGRNHDKPKEDRGRAINPLGIFLNHEYCILLPLGGCYRFDTIRNES